MGWTRQNGNSSTKPDACRQDPVLYSVPCLVILLVFVASGEAPGCANGGRLPPLQHTRRRKSCNPRFRPARLVERLHTQRTWGFVTKGRDTLTIDLESANYCRPERCRLPRLLVVWRRDV